MILFLYFLIFCLSLQFESKNSVTIRIFSALIAPVSLVLAHNGCLQNFCWINKQVSEYCPLMQQYIFPCNTLGLQMMVATSEYNGCKIFGKYFKLVVCFSYLRTVSNQNEFIFLISFLLTS